MARRELRRCPAPPGGQTLIALRGVFARAGKPVNTGGDNWRLGEIQRLLLTGGKAKLKSLVRHRRVWRRETLVGRVR